MASRDEPKDAAQAGLEHALLFNFVIHGVALLGTALSGLSWLSVLDAYGVAATAGQPARETGRAARVRARVRDRAAQKAETDVDQAALTLHALQRGTATARACFGAKAQIGASIARRAKRGVPSLTFATHAAIQEILVGVADRERDAIRIAGVTGAATRALLCRVVAIGARAPARRTATVAATSLALTRVHQGRRPGRARRVTAASNASINRATRAAEITRTGMAHATGTTRAAAALHAAKRASVTRPTRTGPCARPRARGTALRLAPALLAAAAANCQNNANRETEQPPHRLTAYAIARATTLVFANSYRRVRAPDSNQALAIAWASGDRDA